MSHFDEWSLCGKTAEQAVAMVTQAHQDAQRRVLHASAEERPEAERELNRMNRIYSHRVANDFIIGDNGERP